MCSSDLWKGCGVSCKADSQLAAAILNRLNVIDFDVGGNESRFLFKQKIYVGFLFYL